MAQHIGGPHCGLDLRPGGDDRFGGAASIVPSVAYNSKTITPLKAIPLPLTDALQLRMPNRDILPRRSSNRPPCNTLDRIPIQSPVHRAHTPRRSRKSLPPPQTPDSGPPPQMRPSYVPSLSEFTIVKSIGAGQFGNVFLAYHKPSRVQVALKIISKKHTTPTPDQRDWRNRRAGDQTLQRCGGAMEEYFSLRRLAGTPGVAELLASFHDTRYFYIGMVSLHITMIFASCPTTLTIEILPWRRSSISFRRRF